MHKIPLSRLPFASMNGEAVDVCMDEASADEDELLRLDLDNAPLSSIKMHISALHQLCSGQRSPPLQRELLAPTTPYHERSHEVLKWVLSMQAVQATDEVYDEMTATEQTMRRLSRMHSLYESYRRFVPEMRPHDARAVEEQAAHGECHRWWHALGHIHTVLVNVDKMARCMNILTRILFNEEDQIIGEALTDPVRSYQERQFVMAWRAQKTSSDASDETKEIKKLGKVEKVVNHCLDQALAKRYKRLGTCVYEERKIVFNDVVYGTRAYQPAVWPNGDPRRDKSTIQEFVTRACAKERYPEIWEIALDSTVFRKVVDYLERCVDHEFPTLRQRRNLFSFTNGIYDSDTGRCGTFFFYETAGRHLEPGATAAKFFEQEVRPHWFEVSTRMGGWFDIPTPLFQSILDYQNYGEVRSQAPRETFPTSDESGEASLSRHEAALVEVKRSLYGFLETMENSMLDSSYASTPAAKVAPLESMTQHCQSLKDALENIVKPLQHPSGEIPLFPVSREGSSAGASEPVAPPVVSGKSEPGKALPPEVQRWIYIFLGRLLHDLNHHDSWQIMPFLKGKAGTGKSAIGLVAKNFFEPEQVGILSSNIETKFGLGALADAFVILCLEVKKNFQLNQAEFQSIVSGEVIQLAVKNKEAFAKKWTAPGLLCGNEWASYQDAQGSIARRLAIINFVFPISEKDSNPNLLDLILNQELGALLIKCNIGYREQAEIKRGQDIWKILPPYFKHQRRLLQIETDPLWSTIWDLNLFEHVPTGYVSFSDFQKEYVLKWKQIRGNPFPEHLTEDKLGPALKEAKLERAWQKRVDPGAGGDARTDTWILGMRLRRDIPESDGATARASSD